MKRPFLFCLGAWGLFCGTWLLLNERDSGIGRDSGSHASLSSSGRGSDQPEGSSLMATAPADARPSPPEPLHQPRSERARVGEQGRLGGPSPALLNEYEDAFLDTQAGLWSMTVYTWENEEFLALTQDEAHDLLGLDDTLGLKGPGTLQEIVGPLPSQEDCALAYAYQDVKEALREVVVLEVAIYEMGETPPDRRPAGAKERINDAIRMRDAAMEDLMRRCEDATGKEFVLWWRLYQRWSSN